MSVRMGVNEDGWGAMTEFDVTFVPGGSVSINSLNNISYDELDSLSNAELKRMGIERLTRDDIRKGNYNHRLPFWKVNEYLNREGPIYLTEFPVELSS
ncbi:hypothetical protein HFX_2504 [Haloferax mediterranei ATCC 33500]|nr:hypothetical protein HFX_2504 [Haloferax mediterranei ATCC 33500]